MRALVLTVVFFVLAGCGPTTMQDAQSVTSLTQQVEALTQTHTSAVPSAASCAGEMATYRAACGRLLDSMGGMCPGLDGCMSGMGHGDQADLMATVRALRDEVAQHASEGCVAASLADEMARHRAAMTGWCEHLRGRSQALEQMGGPHGMMSGAGCR